MWLCSPLAREQAGEQRAARLHPACAGPALPAARCPPRPALSFFLPRPFGVFGVCIFSAFSTSATELTPESVFFSRSVLESPWREEEGCAHKCGGGAHPLLSEQRWKASRLGARSLAAPPPSDANVISLGIFWGLLWEGNGRGT